MSTPASEPKHAERFFINVLWNWLTVAVSLFVNFYLTRYLIRRLTDEQYGIWSLAFSLMEYIMIFDLGLRTAIVNFMSHLRVQRDVEGMNEVLSTALTYYVGLSAAALVAAITLSGQGYRAFNITPANRGDFGFLLMLVGFIWAGAVVTNVFQASLDAFQAFDITNKIFVGTVLVRSVCLIVLLYLGYGLRPLGVCTVVAQLFGWVVTYYSFRKLLPEVKLGFRYVRSERWKEMVRYGIKSVFSNCGTLFLNQGPPLVVGHYVSATAAGYYGLPFRLLNYMVDLIARIGFVTAPKTAELWAQGKREQIGRLGTCLNRYCFALFLPGSIFLFVYGAALLGKWLGKPEFVSQAAPLLPIFTAAVSLAISAQYNSSSMLFGMAKHGLFAASVVIESILALIGMAFVLPHYGIIGGACVAATLMFINRGLITPFLVCRALPYSYFRYMSAIYFRPLLCAIPVFGLAMWLKSSWLPGQTLMQLMLAGVLVMGLGLSLALVFCIEPEHRLIVWDFAMKKLGKKAPEPVPASGD